MTGRWSDAEAGDQPGEGAGADDALRILARVAEREVRPLDDELSLRIAQMSARIRRDGQRGDERADAPDAAGSAPVELVPISAPPSGSRPAASSRRWAAMAASAAVLLIAVVAVRAVGQPDRVVGTVGGAASGPSGGSTEGVIEDPRDTVPPAEGQPRPQLLDLTRLPTTFDDPTAPTTGPVATSAPTTVAETTEGPSTAPTAVTPSSTPETGTGSSAPTGDGAITIGVGAAGAVTLRLGDGRAEIIEVIAAPGWDHVVDESAVDALDVRFASGGLEASLAVTSDPASFRLVVDDGGTSPAGTVRTRTWTLGSGGSIVLSTVATGVRSLTIDLDGGWTHQVDTIAPGRLRVRVTAPVETSRYHAEVTAGPFGFDLDVVGR